MIPHPSSRTDRPLEDGPDVLEEVARLAGEPIREAASRLLTAPPADLARLGEVELGGHVLWLAKAMIGDVVGTEDDGAILVVRRHMVDLLRTELVRSWAEKPATASKMVDLLTQLERARAACVPAFEQSLAAELADRGGLDLVVEVAHDMRSPLTSILFLSEILHRGQSGPLNDVQKRQVGIVYSAALSLVSMASDLIEMARGGSRLSSRNPSPFSVNELLNSVRALVGPTAEEKGVELRIVSLRNAHRLGHPVALSRVLLNLTTNAMKFTQEGQVELSARPVRGTLVEFAVRDTGPGIPPDAIDTLYQPFKREPTRQTGYSFSGTGLGLAICRRLVAAMGSELVVESEENNGTRFSFTLELPPASSL